MTWPLFEIVDYYVSKELVRKPKKRISKIRFACVCATGTMRVKVAYELSTRKKHQLIFVCYEDVTWLCSALKTNLLNRTCCLMRNQKTNDTSCQLSTDFDTTCAIE